MENNVALPKGTAVRMLESIDKTPMGKIVAHRPVRLEGFPVAHIYAVKESSSGVIHLLLDKEVSNDVI